MNTRHPITMLHSLFSDKNLFERGENVPGKRGLLGDTDKKCSRFLIAPEEKKLL